MSGSLKLALYILIGVVAAYIGIKLVLGLLSSLLSLLIPVAILAAVVFVIYTVVSRKALGGGRRYLP
jgi:hypothetical protein